MVGFFIAPLPATFGAAMTENMQKEQPSLPEAARRALAEAEARRKAAPPQERPPETGGRKGPDPVRYGDWEKNGLAVDF
jgi:hypothetical protein